MLYHGLILIYFRSNKTVNDTTGLLSKSASKGQYDIINKLRNLLIDLSSEALRDMNIGQNQRAKRFLSMLSEININSFQGK